MVINDPSLPESAVPLIADRNTLVIIKPWLDPTWQAALEAPLRSLGKEPCPIRATNGDVRFILWHAPDAAGCANRIRGETGLIFAILNTLGYTARRRPLGRRLLLCVLNWIYASAHEVRVPPAHPTGPRARCRAA